MLEEGHFPELSRLLESIVAQGKSYQKDYDEIRRGAFSASSLVSQGLLGDQSVVVSRPG